MSEKLYTVTRPSGSLVMIAPLLTIVELYNLDGGNVKMIKMTTEAGNLVRGIGPEGHCLKLFEPELDLVVA